MSNFRRLITYLHPYRRRVAVTVALMALVTFTAIPMPRITQYVIDVILPQKRGNAFNWVFWAVFLLYTVRGIASFTLNYMIAWIGQRVVFDLRFQSYRHLNRLSLSYYDGRQPGKIMARLTGDIDVIQYALTQGFVYLITDLATLFIVIGWLFYLEWRLALL